MNFPKFQIQVEQPIPKGPSIQFFRNEQYKGYTLIAYVYSDLKCQPTEGRYFRAKQEIDSLKAPITEIVEWHCSRNNEGHVYIIPPLDKYLSPWASLVEKSSAIQADNRCQFQRIYQEKSPYSPMEKLKVMQANPKCETVINSTSAKPGQLINIFSSTSVEGSNLDHFDHLIALKDNKDQQMVSLCMKKLRITDSQGRYIKHNSTVSVDVPAYLKDNPLLSEVRLYDFKYSKNRWFQTGKANIMNNKFVFDVRFGQENIIQALTAIKNQTQAMKQANKLENESVKKKIQEIQKANYAKMQRKIEIISYKQAISLQNIYAPEEQKISPRSFRHPQFQVSIRLRRSQDQSIESYHNMFQQSNRYQCYNFHQSTIEFKRQDFINRLEKIVPQVCKRRYIQFKDQNYIKNLADEIQENCANVRNFFSKIYYLYDKMTKQYTLKFLENGVDEGVKQLLKRKSAIESLGGQISQYLDSELAGLKNIKKDLQKGQQIVMGISSYPPDLQNPPEPGGPKFTPHQASNVFKRCIDGILRELPKTFPDGEFEQNQDRINQNNKNFLPQQYTNNINKPSHIITTLIMNDIFDFKDQSQDLDKGILKFNQEFIKFIDQMQNLEQNETMVRFSQEAEQYRRSRSELLRQLQMQKQRKINEAIAQRDANVLGDEIQFRRAMIGGLIAQKCQQLQVILRGKINHEQFINDLFSKFKANVLCINPKENLSQLEEWFKDNKNFFLLSLIEQNNTNFQSFQSSLNSISSIVSRHISADFTYQNFPQRMAEIDKEFEAIKREVLSFLNGKIEQANKMTEKQSKEKISAFFTKMSNKYLEIVSVSKKVKDNMNWQTSNVGVCKNAEISRLVRKINEKIIKTVQDQAEYLKKQLCTANIDKDGGNPASQDPNKKFVVNIYNDINTNELLKMQQNSRRLGKIIEQIKKAEELGESQIRNMKIRFSKFLGLPKINNLFILTQQQIRTNLKHLQTSILRFLQRIDVEKEGFIIPDIQINAKQKIKQYFDKFRQIQINYTSMQHNIDLYRYYFERLKQVLLRKMPSFRLIQFPVTINISDPNSLSRQQYQRRKWEGELPKLQISEKPLLNQRRRWNANDKWAVYYQKVSQIERQYLEKKSRMQKDIPIGNFLNPIVSIPLSAQAYYQVQCLKRSVVQQQSSNGKKSRGAEILKALYGCNKYYAEHMKKVLVGKSISEIRQEILNDKQCLRTDQSLNRRIAQQDIHPELLEILTNLGQKVGKFKQVFRHHMKKNYDIKGKFENMAFSPASDPQQTIIWRRCEQEAQNQINVQKDRIFANYERKRIQLLGRLDANSDIVRHTAQKKQEVNRMVDQKKQGIQANLTQMKKLLAERKLVESLGKRKIEHAKSYYKRLVGLYCILTSNQYQPSDVQYQLMNEMKEYENLILKKVQEIYKQPRRENS